MVDHSGVCDQTYEQCQRYDDVGCKELPDHAYKKVLVRAKEIYKMYKFMVTIIAEMRRCITSSEEQSGLVVWMYKQFGHVWTGELKILD